MAVGADGVEIQEPKVEADAQSGAGKTVPLAALEDERSKRQALEARLAKIESDRKVETEKAATESGKYKELYEPLKGEHERATARLTELEKRETDREARVALRNEERIKALPEKAAKALAPIASKLTPDDLADWLDSSLSSLVEEAPTFRPSGTVAGSGKKVEEPIPAAASAEWQKWGKRTGVSEREYFEFNWKRRHPSK